jgi:hypothetical protein
MQKDMQYKGKSICILILIVCVFFNLKSIFSLFLYLEVIYFVFTYSLCSHIFCAHIYFSRVCSIKDRRYQI